MQHTLRRVYRYYQLLPVCFIFLVVTGCHVQREQNRASTYYLDGKDGDDANTGLSAEQAWKSLDKIKSLQLKPGDSLLFKSGTSFNGVIDLRAMGTSSKRIVVGRYGSGKKPLIAAPDSSLFAVRISNSDYLTLQHLEIVNTGSQVMPYRTGLKVEASDFGISHHVVINALDIHDVNGSVVKEAGGGSGILIVNRGDSVVSVFDSLTIENCRIRRCERNGIIWNGYANRQNWHPSTHAMIRKNLIEEVPGDGIVPIGCDGAVIAYNLMRNASRKLPQGQSAAGIWPWSCDNTIIQFNEVGDHKSPWDAQGFDSDWNCTNTTIQYNFSHDNEGGFLLVCNFGKSTGMGNVGNVGTLVLHNISINDGVRPAKTEREGFFSPTIHIAGPVLHTQITNNIFHASRKPAPVIDRTLIHSNSWEGYADSTLFSGNVFFAEDPSRILLTQSTHTVFKGNYYLGEIKGTLADASGSNASVKYDALIKKGPRKGLSSLMDSVTVGDGAANVKFVNKGAIEQFFITLKEP